MIHKIALESPFILDFTNNSIFAKFSCNPGCINCCGYGYFLPSEIDNLSNHMKEKLEVTKDGKYEIIRKEGRCIFYIANSENEFFCSIYEIRPLRCKIYPYFPLIVDQRIVITLEPALKMKNDTTQIKTCPGIGILGKPLKNTIKDCLSFLEKLYDVPALLSTIVLDSEAFSKIRNDRWFIENMKIK